MSLYRQIWRPTADTVNTALATYLRPDLIEMGYTIEKVSYPRGYDKRLVFIDKDGELISIPDYTDNHNLPRIRELWQTHIKPYPHRALGYYQGLVELVTHDEDGNYIFGVNVFDEVTNASAHDRALALYHTLITGSGTKI